MEGCFMEEYKLNMIAFHITDNCSAHCPMCYESSCKNKDLDGEIETLKQIVHNAIANGKVENFLLVGGDPCEHPHMMELLRFIKSEGEKYDVKTFIEVLSNTHDYRENGEIVPMEEVAKYVDKLNITVHGVTAGEHDSFNGVPGSYNHMMENVRNFIDVKTDEQSVGITVNVMPQTFDKIGEIVYNTNLDLGGAIKDICVQRIAPVGRAAKNPKRYLIEKQDIDVLMPILAGLKENGYGLEICDCFPHCSIKPEYRHLLPEGGCNWGTEIISVSPKGDITRCALSDSKLSANMTELDSPEKFLDWWMNDPELVAFRKKYHLDEACKRCAHSRECGGACVIASAANGGIDPLATPPNQPEP